VELIFILKKDQDGYPGGGIAGAALSPTRTLA
jgi:hypothetical protein